MLQMDELIANVDKLTENTPAVWGKMTPQHMVEHVAVTLWISAGKIPIKCYTPAEKIPFMLRFLDSDKPMPRNFVSPAVGENLLPLRYGSLEEAIQNFKAGYEAFKGYFEANPEATLTNPAYGELNYAQWQKFHKKHITHHFAQFGLVEG
jgi:hypothetical protein